MPSYRAALFSVLSTAATDPATTFDAARLKEVAKFALQAVRTTVAASSAEATRTLWNADAFATVLEEFRTSDRFKGAVAIQSIVKQLVAVLGGGKPTKAVAGVKRKSVEEEPAKENTTVKSSAKKPKKSKRATAPAEVEVEVEEEEVEEEVETAPAVGKSKSEKKEKRKEKKKRDASSK